MSQSPLEGFQQTFERTVELRTVCIILAVTIFMGILAFVANRLWKEHRNKKNWNKFRNRLRDLDIPEDLMDFLLELVHSTHPRRPFRIIEDKFQFEKSVNQYADRVLPTLDADLLERREDQIKRLRRELKKIQPADSEVIYSTREIPEGTILGITAEKGEEFQGKVKENTARHMQIEVDAELSENLKGIQVEISCYIGQNSFRFQVKPTIADRISNILKLPHTINLTDTSKRGYSRVEVNAPIKVHWLENGKKNIYNMELIDISAGGVALKYDENLEFSDETRVWLEVSPEKLISEFKGKLGENEKEVNKGFHARIIARRKAEDGSYVYPCQFEDTTESQRLYLLRVIRWIRAQKSK